MKDLLRRMGAGGMPHGQETKDEDTDFLRRCKLTWSF